jgi:predicted ATP-grasp superfamily ATP-dependent carboligase
VEALRWNERPDLERPVMIAAFEGWNDAADAASGAAGYLARSWNARPFAEIDPEVFFDFTATRPQVRLEEGRKRVIDWPANVMAVAKVPSTDEDVVILQGVEPQLKWRTFCEGVVTAARDLEVELVVTLGALLAEVPHTRPVRVTGTAGNPEVAARLGLKRSRYEGPTGIVGVLHDSFSRARIPSASMWANVPHYLGQTPSPKATLALVTRTADLLGSSVQTTDLEIASASYERQVNELVAADEDAADYVARLERQEPEDGDESAGDALAAEAERFLRGED